ncbi:hypothetical protein [Nocardiopsis composta]|uniref:Uncharacterized protein n=1 Tax=Nocardiopsis composta TaxID=157465 RepID=A0A7W8QLR8_9ACTN|nr:hypothetical protein [Nocardiopsis composta]MBB5432344.1 hypothetical protein [Nocardiopsis composta]
MADDSSRLSPGSGRRRRTAVLIAAVLAVQVAVPAAVQLTAEERPGRFGWQMYSGRTPAPEVEAVSTDGTVVPFRKSDIGANRAEVRLDEALLTELCALEPEVAEFRVHRPEESTTVDCGEHR